MYPVDIRGVSNSVLSSYEAVVAQMALQSIIPGVNEWLSMKHRGAYVREIVYKMHFNITPVSALGLTNRSKCPTHEIAKEVAYFAECRIEQAGIRLIEFNT